MKKVIEILERVINEEPILYLNKLYYPYCIYGTYFLISPNKFDLGSDAVELSFEDEFESDNNYLHNEALLNLIDECVGGKFWAEGFIEDDYSLVYTFKDGSENVFYYSDEKDYLHDISILEKVYKITVF